MEADESKNKLTKHEMSHFEGNSEFWGFEIILENLEKSIILDENFCEGNHSPQLSNPSQHSIKV